jgi:5-methylthioadenosine/S-adenosylhomocysteine deaminase
VEELDLNEGIGAMKILLRDGIILTMAGKEPEILKGDIGIEGDRISFLGKTPVDFNAEKEIDASGSLIMPGLINAHTHISMSLMRHYADDLPFWNWLFDRIIPVEEKLTGREAYDGAMLSLVEMIRGGITAFADMYFFMDRVAEATVKAGLRANLCRGLAFEGPDDLYKLEESRSFFSEWNGKGGGRIMVDLGPHAVYTCPPEFLEKTALLADELGCRIHIHLSESRKEVEDSLSLHGKSPVAHLRDLGILDRKTYAAHCVHLLDGDIEILRQKKTAVINNPSSNLKLGNGFAPVSKLLAAGVTLGLGTDGPASNNNLNMFEEMHLAALINKGIEENPTAVSAYTVLRMATIDGARALGLDGITGSLEKGKKADLILIDLNGAHLCPLPSVTAALVYAAQGSDVKTVICNGEILMEDRQLTGLDEEEIIAKARESAARITTTR